MKFIIISVLILISSTKVFSQPSGWTHYDFGLTSAKAAQLSALFVGNAYVGGDSGYVVSTTNFGGNWANVLGWTFGDIKFFAHIDLSTVTDYTTFSDTFWVGCNAGKIVYTSNGGSNWILQTTGTTSNINGISFVNNQTGWAVGNSGTIIKTTNGGNTWSPQTSTTTTVLQSVSFYDANTGWCTGLYTTGGAPIIKTTNGGTTWTTVFSSGVSTSYYGIKFINQNTGWICGSANSFGLIMKTTNGGLSWIDQNAPSGKILRRIYFTPIGDTGYCAGALDFLGNTGRILKTINGGANWFSQTLTSGTKDINDIKFINASTGIAVGNNGTILITRSGGEPIGIHPISNEVPNGFSLEQNYPNPFNPTTKIRFQVARTPLTPLSQRGDNVRLVVFDALGREVETLVNEQLKPGTYEVDFDGSNFASGVYYYKLVATVPDGRQADYTETKKMVLVK